MEDEGVEFSFVGDRFSTAWAGGCVSTLEVFSEGDSGGGLRKGGGEKFAGESEVMTEVGGDFIGRGQFSTVLFTGVVGFESNRLQTRLVSYFFWFIDGIHMG